MAFVAAVTPGRADSNFCRRPRGNTRRLDTWPLLAAESYSAEMEGIPIAAASGLHAKPTHEYSANGSNVLDGSFKTDWASDLLRWSGITTMRAETSSTLLPPDVVVAALCGALFGMTLSFFVAMTLLELSISQLFSVYFGLATLVTGAWILHRMVRNFGTDDGAARRKQPILLLALLVTAAGAAALIPLRFRSGLPLLLRLPMYLLLGVGAAFSFSFGMVDTINFVLGAWQRNYSSSKPLLQSPAQLSFIVLVAVSLGAIFGLMFGCYNAHSVVALQVMLATAGESKWNFLIGAVLGGVSGALAQHYKKEENRLAWQQLRTAEINVEI